MPVNSAQAAHPLIGFLEGWDVEMLSASGRGSGCQSTHQVCAPNGGGGEEPRAAGVSLAWSALTRRTGTVACLVTALRVLLL